MTRISYEVVELPDEMRSQLEARLARGGHLGRSLAAKLRHGKWRLWTIAPVGWSFEATRSLDEGGVASVKEARSRLSARIDDFLSSQKGRLALFENAMARRGDSWLRQCRSRLAYSRERVLHYAQSGDSEITVDRVIRDAQSPHLLVGAMIEPAAVDLQRDLTDEDLTRLAAMAVAIICDAFDGESYIVAEPEHLPERTTVRGRD